MIIVLLNPIHSVGKTTLATHLADDLSGDGGGTVLIDADPNAGAFRWTRRRLRTHCPSRFHSCTSLATQLREDMQRLGQIAANVVVDLPSRTCPITQLAVLLADVVLVPWQPQHADATVIAAIGRTIAAVRSGRPALRAAVVLNGCVQGEHSAELVRTAWLRECVPVLDAKVLQRRALADSMSSGRLVRELFPRDGAAEDVRQLAQAVRALAA